MGKVKCTPPEKYTGSLIVAYIIKNTQILHPRPFLSTREMFSTETSMQVLLLVNTNVGYMIGNEMMLICIYSTEKWYSTASRRRRSTSWSLILILMTIEKISEICCIKLFKHDVYYFAGDMFIYNKSLNGNNQCIETLRGIDNGVLTYDTFTSHAIGISFTECMSLRCYYTILIIHSVCPL